jgi:protein-S-isoprenylcysteine O-methyltransferase Ste14
MKTFEIIASIIVIVSLVYVSFILTLADWLAALRKGRAVTLLPERNGRSYPFWAQVGMIILGLAIVAVMFYFLWLPLFRFSSKTSFILDVAGLVLYAAGCLFMLWARRTLGKMWGLSTSQQVKLNDDHQIIQAGPYAFVRNPMYFGWWVAMFGLVLLYPVWMVFLMFLFSLVSFAGRARREDKALDERFGEAWAVYKKRTKFLIPYIY